MAVILSSSVCLICVNTGHCITSYSSWCLSSCVSLWAGQDNASDSVGSVIILAVAKEAPLLPQGGPGAATGEDILTAGEPSYDDDEKMIRKNPELRHRRGHQRWCRSCGGRCLYWPNFVLVNIKARKKNRLHFLIMSRLCLLQVWRWHNWWSLSARSPPGVS